MILQTYTISVDLPDDAAITHATHHLARYLRMYTYDLISFFLATIVRLFVMLC